MCLTKATKHNNGPHQDQIFDNPSALCLAMWAKNRIRLKEGTDAPNRLFTKGVQLSVSLSKKKKKKSCQIYSV